MKKTFIILILLTVSLTACTKSNDSGSIPEEKAYTCKKNSDCSIKSIYTCLGFVDRCANKNYEQDVKAKRKICEENRNKEPLLWGSGSYSNIDECKCVNNECKSYQNGKTVIN